MAQIILAPHAPPLHLYRHLLREASYLPPVCCEWASERIRDRFRAHREANGERTVRYRKQGEHDLRILRAANMGDSKRMYRIMLHTFGRIGKRRWELADVVLQRDVPMDSCAVEEAVASTVPQTLSPANPLPTASKSSSPSTPTPPTAQTPSNTPMNPPPKTSPGKPNPQKSKKGLDRPVIPTHVRIDPSVTNTLPAHKKRDTRRSMAFLDRWDLDKLKKFAASQKQHHDTIHASLWPRVLIQRPVPNEDNDLPAYNAWGRPLPFLYKRFRLRSWWLRIAQKVVPPIGQGEWDTLKRLAEGYYGDDVLELPPRRWLATPIHSSGDPSSSTGPGYDIDWREHAFKRASLVERPKSLRMYRLSGLTQPTPYGYTKPPHPIRPRALRRLYGRVWQATPIAVPPSTPGQSTRYVWGRMSKKFPTVSSSLFRGVDSTGKVVSEA